MTNKIASIDGLRALSIFLVIFAHLSSANMIPKALHGTTLGLSGVIMFFVISGFLITSKLLSEKRNTGTIHIGIFLIRRAFRLMPASLLFIFVAWLLAHLGYVRLETAAIVHALTYTMDYYHPATTTLEHLWSLSVEEQFYLVWPFVILMTGLRQSKVACICVIAICPMFRLWGWHYSSIDHELLSRRFEMVADSLAFGCLLAMIEKELPRWLCSNVTVIVSLSLIILNAIVVRRVPSFSIAAITIDSVCAAIVIQALKSGDIWIARVFAWAPLVWLGSISYSLYLWQELFTISTPSISWKIFVFPYNLLGAVTCAVASYYIVETPIRAWGRTFRPKGYKRSIDAQVAA